MGKRAAPRGKSRPRRNAGAGRSGKNRAGYVLCLYVTGTTPRAKAAIMKVKTFCEEHLRDRYQLDVIDVYQQPTLAKEEQIIAAPTLVKKLPLPLKKLVGDFSSTERVLMALDL
jgi:circadian clock protein KaiB